MTMQCALRGAIDPTNADPTTLNSTTTWHFFGNATTCPMGMEKSARPQDAEEFQYKEICKGNQLQTEEKQNSTWNLEYCPSELSLMVHIIIEVYLT